MQNSKTKSMFADIQQKVLHDTTAGSITNPLHILGAALAGTVFVLIVEGLSAYDKTHGKLCLARACSVCSCMPVCSVKSSLQ